MSRKESKFYVINFIDPWTIFFLKKVLTPRSMKTHIQTLYKESKSEGRRCVQGLYLDLNNSLIDAQVH